MSDLKLYRVTGNHAEPLSVSASKLEKDLQKIIEQNMETFFGVRLLASELSTGPVHGGRMDSIGIDENGTPVIFEYKRNVSESVINQGLFYLDWLLDHQGDFKVLVMNRLGAEAAAEIDFGSPRLICVANDFTRYDEHAIRQMGHAIELVRYQQFDGSLLALELIASTTTGTAVQPGASPMGKSKKTQSKTPVKYTTVLENLEKSPPEIKNLYDQLHRTIESLGDDITMNATKFYIAFRRLKNFVSIEVYPQAKKLLVFIKIDPATVTLEPGFSRDVTNIGHLGTGNFELTVRTPETLAKALPLIQQSYEAN
jgi:predicted transport protein